MSSEPQLAPAPRRRALAGVPSLALPRPGKVPRGVWLALLVLVPVLLAWAFWLRGGAVRLDIGGLTDRVVIWNFHEPEANPTDTYRWSTHEATITLPAHILPGIVQVRGAVAPDGTQVTLGVGRQYTVALPPREGTPELRRYQMLFPPDTDLSGSTTLAVLATPPAVTAETRPLGMLIADVQAQSLAPASAAVAPGSDMPPLFLLVLFGAIPLVLFGTLRLATVPTVAAWLAAFGAGCGLVVLWGNQPMWIQPFLSNTLVILGVLLAMAWWLRQAAQRHPMGSLPWLFVALVAFAGIIPIYLYLRFGVELWLHPNNLPIISTLAALLLPFVGARWRTSLVWLVVLPLLAYGLTVWYGAISKDYATDFTALFRGVRSYVQGGVLYNMDNITTNHLGDTYKYPPFFVFMMAPITGLPYVQAILTWHLFNTALLIAAAAMLWKWSGMPLRSWSTLGLVYLVLVFKPVVDTVSSGQADILMLVSLSAALLALQANRWGWWGAILAFPAAIKLYAGYLLLHSIVHRQWRALVGFAAGFAALTAASLLLLGTDIHMQFVRDVLPNIGGGTAWVENQTINGWLNRLVAERIGLLPETSSTIRWLTYGAAAVFTVLTAWRVQRMPATTGFGLWTVTLLVILPIAWMHYQAILVLPLYQLFVRLEQQQATLDWRTLLFLSVAWLLLCFGNQWTFFDRVLYDGSYWSLLLSYKLYGLLLLWGALAFDRTSYQVQTEPKSQAQAAAVPAPVWKA